MVTESVGCMREKKDAGQYFAKILTADSLFHVRHGAAHFERRRLEVILYILACIVSFIPLIALYLWIRNGSSKEDVCRKRCDKALLQGFLCGFPVILGSFVTSLLLGLTGLRESNPLLYQALYKFIVLALVEEAVKYLGFRRVMKKNVGPYSWLDMTVLMSAVGIGFGMMESLMYCIGESIPVVLIRGISMAHAGYGFLVGYFYGKGAKESNPATKWLGLVPAWLMHGMYDFSLSNEFLAINDNLAIVPFILMFVEIVLAIMLAVFVKKAQKKEVYTQVCQGDVSSDTL